MLTLSYKTHSFISKNFEHPQTRTPEVKREKWIFLSNKVYKYSPRRCLQRHRWKMDFIQLLMQFQGQLRWYIHFYVNSEILLPKKFLKSRTGVFKKKTYSKFKKHKIPIFKI